MGSEGAQKGGGPKGSQDDPREVQTRALGGPRRPLHSPSPQEGKSEHGEGEGKKLEHLGPSGGGGSGGGGGPGGGGARRTHTHKTYNTQILKRKLVQVELDLSNIAPSRNLPG